MEYIYTIGRRKTATASLRLYAQKGESEVNEKPFGKYLTDKTLIERVFEPFRAAGVNPDDYMFTVKVRGGGFSSQIDAIKHALARALVKQNPELKVAIKQAGLLTRDPRMVERKKPGLHKARKAEQYSKR